MSVTPLRKPELDVAPMPPHQLVRTMLPNQPDLDAMVQDVLADYSSVSGNDHEYYGLPDEHDVVIVGAEDMIRAIQFSPALRGRNPDEIEQMLVSWSIAGSSILHAPEQIEPFVAQTNTRSVDLGIRFTSQQPGSVAFERDLLRWSIDRTRPKAFKDPLEPFMNKSDVVLLRDVDPVDEAHLIDRYLSTLPSFAGEIVLGQMELVLGEPCGYEGRWT